MSSSRSKSKKTTTKSSAKSHSTPDANITEFFQKSPSTQVRIDLWSPEAEPDKTFVNIREWVKTSKNPEYRPTPKGLTIDPALWDEFKTLVNGFTPTKEGKKLRQKKVKAMADSEDSASDSSASDSAESTGEYLFAVFEPGDKVLPTKALNKAFQHTVDQGLAVESLKVLKPTKGMVVYRARVHKKKVLEVARYATCAKKDGKRQWSKV